MKGTEQFKKTILAYLEDRAVKDELFAKSFSKEGKNIDSCITYILNTIQKSGCNGYIVYLEENILKRRTL